MDNSWDTQMEKFEVPFFSSWNETKFAKHQRLLHKETTPQSSWNGLIAC
jgi:hypothetical protein